MNNEKKAEFLAWLENPEMPYDAEEPANIRYAEKIEYVEDTLDIDIDAEFERDGLACLYLSLLYVRSPRAYRHPNQERMGWAVGTPKGTIDGYSTAVNHYKVFRELCHPRQAD